MNPSIASLMELAAPMADLQSMATCDARKDHFVRHARAFLRRCGQCAGLSPSQIAIVAQRRALNTPPQVALRSPLLRVTLTEHAGIPGVTVLYQAPRDTTPARWLSLREIAQQPSACARLIRDCSDIVAGRNHP